MTDRKAPMDESASLRPGERIADEFPLSRWVQLAEFWARDPNVGMAGTPLPPEGDWDAYTVRLVERRVLPTDAPPGSFPTGSFTFDGAESKIERNPDGSLISLEIRSREAWRLVRIVVSHPSAEPARLQWEWDGSTRGGIAVIGLEADPRPNRSWRVLSQVIPLLRDWEWRRLGRTGRPPGQTTIQNDEQLRPSIAALRHDSRVVTVGHVAAHAGFTVAEVRGYLRVTGRTWREFIGDL